jgi:hypothetical protein
MLVQKLLRIDEDTVQQINNLLQKMSGKEYVSFSAFVRKLIKIGLNNMEKSNIEESFIDKVKNITNKPILEKEEVLKATHICIETIAKIGLTHVGWNYENMIKEICNYSNSDRINHLKNDLNKHPILINYVLCTLRDEGFKISSGIGTWGNVFIIISWDKE